MRHRRLTTGDLAPPFEATALDARHVALDDYRGRKLLLSFFRYGACPLCNLRTALLIDAFPRWQVRGLDVVAVFESPAERLLETVARDPIPFAVIPDPDRVLYKQYTVTASWLGFLIGAVRFRAVRSAFQRGFYPGKGEGVLSQLPAEFLINSEQTIARVYYGKDIGDHLPFSEIDAWLDSTDEAWPVAG